MTCYFKILLGMVLLVTPQNHIVNRGLYNLLRPKWGLSHLSVSQISIKYYNCLPAYKSVSTLASPQGYTGKDIDETISDFFNKSRYPHLPFSGSFVIDVRQVGALLASVWSATKPSVLLEVESWTTSRSMSWFVSVINKA